MHYIELDDNGVFHGVYPLNEEIAGTAFYDGGIKSRCNRGRYPWLM